METEKTIEKPKVSQSTNDTVRPRLTPRKQRFNLRTVTSILHRSLGVLLLWALWKSDDVIVFSRIVVASWIIGAFCLAHFFVVFVRDCFFPEEVEFTAR